MRMGQRYAPGQLAQCERLAPAEVAEQQHEPAVRRTDLDEQLFDDIGLDRRGRLERVGEPVWHVGGRWIAMVGGKPVGLPSDEIREVDQALELDEAADRDVPARRVLPQP